jgi:hypothetical protein
MHIMTMTRIQVTLVIQRIIGKDDFTILHPNNIFRFGDEGLELGGKDPRW